MITIRYFHTGKKLVINPAQLWAALMDKRATVANVVHWSSAKGWVDVVLEGIELFRGFLVARIWGSGAAIAWSLLAVFLIWWLPVGQRAFLEEAFPIVQAAPLVLVFMALWGCLKSLTLLWRLPGLQKRVLSASVTLSCERILPPGSLLADVEPPKIKRRGTVIALAILLLVVTVGNVAMPMPKTKVMIHHASGETTISKKPCRLALGEWWELIPRYVVGDNYGYIYFDAEAEELLVFHVKYTLDNDKNYPVNDVRGRIGTWALNLGQSFASFAQGSMPAGLTNAEEMQFMEEALGDPEVLTYFGDALRKAADEVLEMRFTKLEVEIKVVGVADYQKKMRKYYD